MYLIGLTGNIASGKSTVRRMLEQLGARTLDADALAHAVLLPGTSAWRAVVDEFGVDVLRDDATVDRQKLGARVFADPARLQRLEAITHPAIVTELALWLRETREDIVVVEAVKLIESGLDRYCDAVWIVTTTPAEAERRLVEERQMTEEEAQARLAAQPPLEPKLNGARVVIDNSGSIEATRVEVVRAFAAFDPAQARDKNGLICALLDLSPAPAAALPSTPAGTVQAGPSAPADAARPAHKVEPRPAQPEARQEPVHAAAPAPASSAGPAAPRKAEEQAHAPEASPLSPAQHAVLRESVSPRPTPAPSAAKISSAEQARKLRELADKVSVRRARPGDMGVLGRALAGLEASGKPPSRNELLKRFGKWGYWIAEADGQVLALATWRAENLVAIMRDLWTQSAELAPYVYPPLFAAIEQEAQSLVCEVVAIITNSANDTVARPTILSSGYTTRVLESLHPVWRSVAESELREGELLYIKQLRERMVTTPF